VLDVGPPPKPTCGANDPDQGADQGLDGRRVQIGQAGFRDRQAEEHDMSIKSEALAEGGTPVDQLRHLVGDA